MQNVYAPDDLGRRTLRFMYRQGGIDTRYSVLPDYSLPAAEWQFYPASENLEPFPLLEKRMEWYAKEACKLSVAAVRDCVGTELPGDLTHLITVSCTGMSAPGLDLELVEALGLNANIHRSSVNFMGCYAAIHAMKQADAYCRADRNAKVLIVCTELCTLHFQRDATPDNMTSSLLFADGASALIIEGDEEAEGLHIEGFFGAIAAKGKSSMSWGLSSSGFQMTLSSYVPQLINEDFDSLVNQALSRAGVEKSQISNWCIHPGGKKILEAVAGSVGLQDDDLLDSYAVLREYGNMSSATILFVLKSMMKRSPAPGQRIFGAAFGPGLTMETFILRA